MRPEEDLILVDRVKDGDRGAFDKLHLKYRKVVLNYLYSMLHDFRLAEEITQQTFIKVYLNINKYKPVAKFSTWVIVVARNTAKNELRKRRLRRQVSLETKIGDDEQLTLKDVLKSTLADIEETLRNIDLSEQIRKVLEAMPEKYREVLVLCVIEERSYEEVAQILKTKTSTVGMRLLKARRLFAKLINQMKEEKE